MKRAGFSQGIYQTSSTRKETVGILRILQDGRKFRYAKAGTSNISAGKLQMPAAVAAAVVNKTSIAAAIGTMQLTLTIASATYAEDYFKGGFLQINDAAGEGIQYPIESSTAVAAGTSITIALSEGIKVALTASSEFSLIHNPWMATVESATEENTPVGIPVVAVTAAYYYWCQTSGMAIALSDSTPAKGTMLVPGTVAGSVAAMNATLDIDIPVIGRMFGTAGVDTEYKPIILTIE
jgi:hypothetical protein